MNLVGSSGDPVDIARGQRPVVARWGLNVITRGSRFFGALPERAGHQTRALA